MSPSDLRKMADYAAAQSTRGSPPIADAKDAVAQGARILTLSQERDALLAKLRALVEAAEELADDIADRFDLDSPSTNPGMKFAVNSVREALAAILPLGGES